MIVPSIIMIAKQKRMSRKNYIQPPRRIEEIENTFLFLEGRYSSQILPLGGGGYRWGRGVLNSNKLLLTNLKEIKKEDLKGVLIKIFISYFSFFGFYLDTFFSILSQLS